MASKNTGSGQDCPVARALDVIAKTITPATVSFVVADAARKRDTATVRMLLDQHVDVNAPGADGTPALHWLVRVDDFESARRLIRAGADVSRPNRYGVTPLSVEELPAARPLRTTPAYPRLEARGAVFGAVSDHVVFVVPSL